MTSKTAIAYEMYSPSILLFFVLYTLGQTYKCAVEQNKIISLFMNKITPKLRNMRLYMMFIKLDIDFIKSTIIPCATAADAKTTKLHVENVQAQIEKNKNDTCVVQTYVDLKNIKWGRLAIYDRGLAVGLLQAGVSKQEIGLHCS